MHPFTSETRSVAVGNSWVIPGERGETVDKGPSKDAMVHRAPAPQ